jgi:hypothetical protein
MVLAKIVSGGETGADRAALDLAQARGVPVGGWIPRGRWAEDGRIPEHLASLQETESADPAERTRRNVADSDGTLIVSHGPLAGGSALTSRMAAQLSKACLWIDLGVEPLEHAVKRARAWIEQHQIGVLNVAGPRGSEDPRIYGATFELLTRLLDSTLNEESAAR